MTLLEIEDLTHSFGENALYSGVSFQLHRGEHMGVVGQNGTGKSTLLNILTGAVVPEKGSVRWQNGVRVGFIDQHASLDAGMALEDYLHTAFEALYRAEEELRALYESMSADADEARMKRAARLQERLDREEFYSVGAKVARVAAGLGLDAVGMRRALGTLSGGQRTKAILAKLLLARPDVLLLDEPTNFLDAEHIAWLTEYLIAFPGSFMIVSHDFHFLDAITTCILDIEFHSMKKYHGRYSEYERQKERRRADYATQYAAQRQEIEKLETYIAKNKARASTARMAKGRQKKLDRMEKLPPPSVHAKPQIAFAQAAAAPGRVLTLDRLRVGYGAPLLPELSFALEHGQKASVTGFNGIGKSTFVKTLAGRIPALGGTFSFSEKIRIGYFEQDLRWDEPGMTPLEIVCAAYPGLTGKEARRALARCGVSAKHAMRPVATLSGGEQNKTKLCLLTLSACSFLILDEPTNHLDAETKESLREAILGFEGAALLVCHEEAFYQSCTDRRIDFEALLASPSRRL